MFITNFLTYWKSKYLVSYFLIGLFEIGNITVKNTLFPSFFSDLVLSLQNVTVTLFILLCIDLFTGLYASYRLKQPIISSKLRRTLDKFICYSIGMFISYLFDTYVTDILNLVVVMGIFIGSVELISIFENLTKISGIKFLQVVYDLLSTKLQSVIKIGKKDTI